jgi:hypothetical protein
MCDHAVTVSVDVSERHINVNVLVRDSLVLLPTGDCSGDLIVEGRERLPAREVVRLLAQLVTGALTGAVERCGFLL